MAVNPPDVKVKSQDDEFLEKFRVEIENNLSDFEFNIDVLCENLDISRATLFRKVNTITGESPNDYIKSYRLERAAQLFDQNYGNVKKVSSAVGFFSYNYFSKCFKDKFNQTPTEYRESPLPPPPPEPGSDLTIHDLDREIVARGALALAEKHIIFKEKEGTMQRDELSDRMMEIYNLNLVLSDALKHFGTPELVQKIRLMIEEKKRDSTRSGMPVEEYLDFYEIVETGVRRNARTVALVCLNEDLIPYGNGFFELKVKEYGPTFNLCANEVFYNQPISRGSTCSGVLVAEDLVVTAAHFAKEKNISDLCFAFDYVMEDPVTPVTRMADENIYRGVEILHRTHNPSSDWALVKLDRKVPGREAAAMFRKDIRGKQSIYVIGHPCGLPLKSTFGSQVGDFTDTYFKTDLSIYGGGSGSPVFCSKTHELIGIVSRTNPVGFRWLDGCVITLSYADNIMKTHGDLCIRVPEFSKYVI